MLLPSMKKFSYIFLVYIIINTLIPCYVYADCCDDSAVSGISFFSDSHTEDECDGCSPMFQCVDCIASFITSSNTPLIQLEQVNTIIIHKISHQISTELNSVWQPPKA